VFYGVTTEFGGNFGRKIVWEGIPPPPGLSN